MGGWVELGKSHNGTQGRGGEGVSGAASVDPSCLRRGGAQPQLGPDGRPDRIGRTRLCRRGHSSRTPRTSEALVYVTALAPDEGERVTDVFYRVKPHPRAPKLTPDSDGLIWLPEEAFATAFSQNALADERAVLAAVQRPIALRCITVPAGRPLWKEIPSWFLVAEDAPPNLPHD
jgi:hypothetical protein